MFCFPSRNGLSTMCSSILLSAPDQFGPGESADVLESLILDDTLSRDMDVLEWAGDFGYDLSDRVKASRARLTFEACRKNAAKLQSLLGEELYAQIDSLTEEEAAGMNERDMADVELYLNEMRRAYEARDAKIRSHLELHLATAEGHPRAALGHHTHEVRQALALLGETSIELRQGPTKVAYIDAQGVYHKGATP